MEGIQSYAKFYIKPQILNLFIWNEEFKITNFNFLQYCITMGGGTFSHTACCSGLHARLEAIRMNIWFNLIPIIPMIEEIQPAA